MITAEEATQRVAIGAAHLDATRPGWYERIDIGTLTLADPCGCIVGQLARTNASNFMTGAGILGFDRSLDAVCAAGLDLDRHCLLNVRSPVERERAYQPLQDAWVAAIADRRLAPKGNPAAVDVEVVR